MLNLLARNTQGSDRIFPPAGSDPLSLSINEAGISSDRQAARNLLASACTNFNAWNRFFAPTDPVKRLSLLIFIHHKAVASEIQGQFRQADFFWNALYSDLKLLLTYDTAWERLLKSFSVKSDATQMADPAKAHARLVDELLIDTHIAFYNGHAQDEPAASRAFAHLSYLITLLDFQGKPKEEVGNLLAPALSDQVRIRRDANDLKEAIDTCELLLKYLPENQAYQDLLATLYVGSAPSGFLQKGIDRLEKMIAEYPYNIFVRQALGRIYETKAENLAAAHRIDDAVLEIHKALTFYPSCKDGERLRSHLNRQANKPGLLAAEQYWNSSDAQQTRYAYYVASAHRLWRDIGLAKSGQNEDEIALRLLMALDQLTRNPQSDSATIESRWHTLAEQDMCLARLDSTIICDYLKNRSHNNDEVNASPVIFPAPVNPPHIFTVKSEKQRPAMLLPYYFFNQKNLRLRAQIALTIVLFLIWGGLSLRDYRARDVRNQTFDRILESFDHNQLLSVIESAEVFFDNPPLAGADGRERVVLDYYDRALIRWLLERAEGLDTDARAHLERYNRLTAAIRKEEAGNEY